MIFHLPRCRRVFTLVLSSELLDAENVGVAFGISLLSCIEAEKYFRFSGCHLEFFIFLYINWHRREWKLLTYSLSHVLQVFLIEQYAFDTQATACSTVMLVRIYQILSKINSYIVNPQFILPGRDFHAVFTKTCLHYIWLGIPIAFP